MTSWRLADADWNSWPDGLDDAQVWERAADLKLDGVELGVYDVGVQLAPARLVELARLVERTGVPVTGVLLWLPADRWPDGALSGDVDRLVVQVAACAVACRALNLPALGLLAAADPAGADVTTALTRAVLAADGVPLALKHAPDTAVPTATAALELCGRVDGLGVLLDTGRAFAGGDDPAELVRLLGPRLLHCHLSDAQPAGEQALPCGRVHDFGALVAALDAAEFGGTASFDLSWSEAASEPGVRESRDHLLSRRSAVG